MDNQVRTEVAIIGAGISGLTAGHFLKQQGRDICILEKSGRIGGAIRSERRDGFLIEFGPNSILDTTPLLHDMFSRLNINNDLEYANDTSKNRYIVRHGRLNPLPASPLAFLRSRLFSTSAKLRLLKEPFIAPADPDVDESLADFVQRRLGREFLDYAINPFVAGVYAGKPEARDLGGTGVAAVLALVLAGRGFVTGHAALHQWSAGTCLNPTLGAAALFVLLPAATGARGFFVRFEIISNCHYVLLIDIL